MRSMWIVTIGLTLAASLGAGAQEFQPPRVSQGDSVGTRLGLFGFGTRGGIDVSGRSQLVFGTTLDVGNLVNNRVRLRPSGEIGVFNGPNTFAGSLEALFRLTEDDQLAIPYVGLGFSIAGREDCSRIRDCPDFWANFVFGFELHYRSTYNWLLEYHGMDAFRQNRLYVGLTTRRGS